MKLANATITDPIVASKPSSSKSKKKKNAESHKLSLLDQTPQKGPKPSTNVNFIHMKSLNTKDPENNFDNKKDQMINSSNIVVLPSKKIKNKKRVKFKEDFVEVINIVSYKNLDWDSSQIQIKRKRSNSNSSTSCCIIM